MKKIFFLSLAIIFTFTQKHFGQNKITGQVIDKATNQPISGASIYVSQLKVGSFSDKNGNYLIEKLPNGNYLLEISHIGFKSQTKNILINGNNISVDFPLNESPTELNEVIITAVTRSTEINKSPVIITAIDANKIFQNSSSNLIDAIRNIPGISQITTGAAISKPTIRGLGYNRVISLVDGIKQEGQQWGDEHGIEIDEYSIDRVEIVKGPGSLLYGSDGIAGVLNFISPKALPLGTAKMQTISNFQSNNNLIGNSISYAGNNTKLQWLGRLSNKIAGNYHNKYDGKVYNSGFKELNGSLFLGINKKWGYSHLNLSSYNGLVNLIEGNRDSLGNFTLEKPDGNTYTTNSYDLNGYKFGIPNQLINHIRLSNSSYFKTKKGSINTNIGFQNNRRREFGQVQLPKNPDLYFDLNSLNYNIRYNLEAKNGWETTLGLGGMLQKNKNKGIEFIIPAYRIFDVGTYLFTQKTFKENFTLSGGLRIDNRSLISEKLLLKTDNPNNPIQFTKFEALKKRYFSVSGSAGLSYQLDQSSTLKFNLSRGFRAPNIAEIASNGQHEGTFRYEIGNANLRPEISQQIDLAYFLNADHVTIEVSPFSNFISNYIFSEKLNNPIAGNSIPDFGNSTSAFKYVQGNAQLLGVELYIDVHPHPFDWLHIENSFSFVNATLRNQVDSLKYLPFIPPAKYRGEIKAHFKKIGQKVTNAYLKIALDHYFAQNRFLMAYETETATPSYSQISIGMGLNLAKGMNKNFMNFYLNADNLTNTAYQSHLSRLKYAPINPATERQGVFNMGRNYSLKMIVNF